MMVKRDCSKLPALDKFIQSNQKTPAFEGVFYFSIHQV